jgi:hypothetical protein
MGVEVSRGMIMSIISSDAPFLDSFIVASSVYDVADITDGKVRSLTSQNELFLASGCSREKLGERNCPIAFLDGAVVAVSLEGELQENSSLQKNLRIGLQTIKYTQETIPCSGNHMQRVTAIAAVNHKMQSKSPGQKRRHRDDEEGYLSKRGKTDDENREVVIAKMRETLGNNRRQAMDAESFQMDDQLATSLAKKSGIGNCCEMAMTGYEYIRDTFPDKRVEIVKIVNGDHVFLVIGREEQQPLNQGFLLSGLEAIFQIANKIFMKNTKTVDLDYRTWKSDVVVCDPWSGSCYPASKINQYLMDYCDLESSIGRRIPCVTPFDPTVQSLELLSYEKKQ